MTAIRAITAVDEAVGRVAAQREADGQPDGIDDPGLYRILDGIMAGRETTSSTPAQRAARRRKAVERSRARVPYSD